MFLMPPPRADGLIVHLSAVCLAVFLKPFQVQRGGKGRAGPVDLLRLSGRAAENGHRESRRNGGFERLRE